MDGFSHHATNTSSTIDHSMTTVPLLLLYLLRITVISTANDFASMAQLASIFHPKPPKWSSNSSSFCDWYGVTCDPTNKYVYSLHLQSMDISGSLPLQFPSLPFLKVLDLSQNSLAGSVPSLVKLSSLESLALDKNKFTSITKDFFLSLPTSLQTLNLRNNLNLVPWMLPFEISRLKNLSFFVASNACLEGTLSDISGSLTPEFPPLPSLKWLDLSDNSLSGPVPSVTKLTSLESLLLLKNKFTEITEDFFLSLPSALQILDLSNNVYLSPWVIPFGFPPLKNLSAFRASNASLRGTIPDIFSSLNLRILILSHNSLGGILPPSMGKSQLLQLFLSDQAQGLSGSLNTLPTILSLESLDLSNNKFTGLVPDFSDCRNFIYISLKGNMLQGPNPKFLLKNASKHVYVDGNNFCTENGEACDPQVTVMLEIAECFGYPLKLADSWKGNDVCRDWDFLECNLQNEIVVINFASQDFHGKVCSTFSKLKMLQYLYLNDNHLTGSIPESLVNLPHLLVLDVSSNNLSGRVPPFKPSMKLIVTGNLLLNTTDSYHKGRNFIANTIIISVEILCTILGVLCIIYIGKRKLIEHKEGKGETDAVEGKDIISKISNVLGKKDRQLKIVEAKTIQSWELAIATHNFHPSNKLGQGGFGIVYKGKLQDGREVAVKRLSHASTQGLEEFLNEVLVTSKLQHRNVIRLLACCADGEEKMLVYEHMPNKSLDAFLFDPTKQKILDWRKRYNILKGISSGLYYLHKDCRERIIHRDLNASNILLDEELNPKISDFGTSRIVRSDEERANTTKIVGTYGYMPPEYAMKGQFSEKSDVFSFGVLILEIVSGSSNTSFCNDEQSSSLLEHAWTLWKGGDVVHLIDPVVYEQCFLEEILKCIHVGLLCVQHSVECRPTISAVISMLESDVEGLPAPSLPGFVQECE